MTAAPRPRGPARLRGVVLVAAALTAAGVVLATRPAAAPPAADADADKARTPPAATASSALSAPELGTAAPPRPTASAARAQASALHGDDADIQYRPGEPAAPTPTALALAEEFARAWARPDLDAPRWWDGVAGYCEIGFAALLRTVDPANVAARRITGPPRARTSRSDLVVVDVPTDAGILEVTTANLAHGWKVTGNDFRASAP